MKINNEKENKFKVKSSGIILKVAMKHVFNAFVKFETKFMGIDESKSVQMVKL